MIPPRRIAAAVTAVGGRAAFGAAVIMLAACGGQHTGPRATTPPATSSPAPHSSNPAAAATGSVHLPAQLLRLKKNTSTTAMQALSILRRQLASRLTGKVVGEKAAIYGGEQNAPLFFLVVAGAWAKRVTSLDDVAHGLREYLATHGFADARLLPAGPSGEALICGHKHVQTGTDTLCYWADPVSFGIVLYPPRFISSLSEGASRTSQIRSAVVG